MPHIQRRDNIKPFEYILMQHMLLQVLRSDNRILSNNQMPCVANFEIIRCLPSLKYIEVIGSNNTNLFVSHLIDRNLFINWVNRPQWIVNDAYQRLSHSNTTTVFTICIKIVYSGYIMVQNLLRNDKPYRRITIPRRAKSLFVFVSSSIRVISTQPIYYLNGRSSEYNY